MADIPVIQTVRLILRPMTYDDWPAYRALMLSDRSGYMGGPFETATAWGMFCSDAVQWDLFGHGALMMDDRVTGNCVGQVCINHGPLFPEHELGWMLFDGVEGRGYALEGALALRDWAFKKRKLATLVSYIDRENQRSIALAKRLGAYVDPHALRYAPDDLVFRHPRS